MRYKAEHSGYQVPDEILETIAERIQSNIRELEGAFNRVVAFAELSGSPITAELAEIALADLLPPSTEIQPSSIVAEVAKSFNLTAERLLSRKDRSRGRSALPRTKLPCT